MSKVSNSLKITVDAFVQEKLKSNLDGRTFNTF
jgi:hypothetical protein